MKRYGFAAVLVGMLCLWTALPIQAQAAHPAGMDWYGWYRELYGYLGSVGGILCSPGTDLQFHKDGKITAVSRDATCQASLEGLYYPLPNNAPLNQLSLTVRKHSFWPLSARALREAINTQVARATLSKFP